MSKNYRELKGKTFSGVGIGGLIACQNCCCCRATKQNLFPLGTVNSKKRFTRFLFFLQTFSVSQLK